MKTILITGSTSGIGRFTALWLARRGFRVFASGRNSKALQELHVEAKSLPLETLRLDVTSPSSIESAKTEIDQRTHGDGLDVLINNAGYGLPGPVEELEESDLRAQFETNFMGLVAVTKAFIPSMRVRGSGRILNVSSIGGRMTFPFFGAYHATKYAVEAISDALRLELASFGVQVVLIEPGVIRSNFQDRSVNLLQRRADSPYAPALAVADKFRAFVERRAVGPECIAKLVEKAITIHRPKARYVSPWNARVFMNLTAMVPTRLLDRILRAFTGLTPKTLGVTQPKECPASPAEEIERAGAPKQGQAGSDRQSPTQPTPTA